MHEVVRGRADDPVAPRYKRPVKHRALARKYVIGQFKGSADAKRATKRGGNHARSRRPRLVAHHLGINTRVCRRCGLSAHQIVNKRLEWCEGR